MHAIVLLVGIKLYLRVHLIGLLIRSKIGFDRVVKD